MRTNSIKSNVVYVGGVKTPRDKRYVTSIKGSKVTYKLIQRDGTFGKLVTSSLSSFSRWALQKNSRATLQYA